MRRVATLLACAGSQDGKPGGEDVQDQTDLPADDQSCDEKSDTGRRNGNNLRRLRAFASLLPVEKIQLGILTRFMTVRDDQSRSPRESTSLRQRSRPASSRPCSTAVVPPNASSPAFGYAKSGGRAWRSRTDSVREAAAHRAGTPSRPRQASQRTVARLALAERRTLHPRDDQRPTVGGRGCLPPRRAAELLTASGPRRQRRSGRGTRPRPTIRLLLNHVDAVEVVDPWG